MTPAHTGVVPDLLGRLGAACVRRRTVVVAVWLALVAALVGLVIVYGRPTDNDVQLPGSDSQMARDLAGKGPGGSGGPGGGLVVVQAAGDGRLDDAAAASSLRQAEAALRTAPHVTAVRAPAAGAGSLSADGRTGYFTVTLDVGRRDLTPAVSRAVTDAAQHAAGPAVTVMPGGSLADAADRTGGDRSELVGLAVAAVVLSLALGGVLGALLSIGTSIVALAAAICTIGLAGHATTVPSVASTLATMVGLGVGIDYALFLLTRHRELLHAGEDVPGALARSVSDSGSAVVFAGVTVMVALGGLAVADVPILTTLAWTCAIAVVLAVAAAITLLPALASFAGNRLVRRPGRSRSRRAAGSGWASQADRVTRHPWLVAGASLALLALLAAPAADLRLGQLDAGDFPPGTAARAASDALTGAFGAGSTSPLTVVAELQPTSTTGAEAEPRLQALSQTLRTTPGVAAVGPFTTVVTGDPGDGTIATAQVTPVTAPGDPATADLVHRLRALPVADGTVHVGGVVAAKADLTARIAERLPWVVALVLALSVAVLLVAFRAPFVAVKAALMDLVSIGAAYGAVTVVFGWGWGVTLTGLSGPVPVESYLPLMLFALLFGLSMDYEVFLLSAVQQARSAGRDDRTAVRDGLAATGGVITAAATVMVSVFIGFVPVDDPAIKMFGLGMAVAVAVDATIVRGLLAPATMALFGRVTWWVPGRRDPRQVRAEPACQAVQDRFQS